MIAIVVSTYDEAENLPLLVSGLCQALDGHPYRIIVVDDNSPDGTAQVAQELSKQYPITLVLRPCKLGLGSAVLAGLAEALSDPQCQQVVTMDADLSHDPAEIRRLLEASSGVDLVQGSKHIAGSSVHGFGPFRRFLSWGANLLLRVALRSPMRDNTGSYRVYSRRMAELILREGLPKDYEYAPFAVLLALENGMALREVPITFADRRRGKSKVTARIIFRSLAYAFRIGLRRTFGRRSTPSRRTRNA